MMVSFWRRIFILVLVFAILALMLTSPTPVSALGLTIQSKTPDANALDVARASNIVVQFSTTINGDTVSESTFNVDGSLSGHVSGSYSGGGTDTITFDPTNDFKAGETITVTLTTGIESQDGAILTDPLTWQFVVAAPQGYATFKDSEQSLGSANSRGVVLGDVDGDGDLDAFVANYGANKVLENYGTGTFTEKQSLGSANSRGVALGDVDGDGDLDAFVANYGANSVLENYGTGAFTEKQSLGSANSRGVALDDLDGDGDLDAFVANDGADKVWENDGSGYFTVSQAVGSSKSYGVALGDLDGDGDLDVLVACSGGNVVWLNDGSGNFTSGQTIGIDRIIYDVALGDLDGDGDLDAFAANYGKFNGFWWEKKENEVWLNNGDGTFALKERLGDFRSTDVALGDVDGDGDLDALVANYGANKVWLNNGSGNFTGGQSLGSADSYGVALGDLDGDSYLDAFVANDGANEVWLNNGSGNFTEKQSLGSADSAGVALGDLDGDGDLDAFVANYGANSVLENYGTGAFTEKQSLGSANSRGVALGDLDGDGDLDAFVANYGANKVLENYGTGAFTEKQSLGSADSRGVALGDLDGDGDLDAFVANDGANEVWLNNGSGNFSDSEQSLGSSKSYDVALGDLDGDGDLDAFVANDGANRVWENDGNGTFTSGQSLLTGYSDSYGVALGDLNGDGDLDAFVTNYGLGVEWVGWFPEPNIVWENDGSGHFTVSQEVGYSYSTDVALGDVDGDSDLDAFVANGVQAGSGVMAEPTKVWLNNGNGTFEEGQSLGSEKSRGVALGDLSSDGDLDAFAANNGANRVWLNTTFNLIIFSRTPDANDLDVARTSDIEVQFSTTIIGDTVNENTFNVDGSLSGEVSGSYSVVTDTITFDPTYDFKAGETVTVTLTTGIEGEDGTTLADPVTWQFVVAAPQGYANFTAGESLGTAYSGGVALGDVDGDSDLDAFVANGMEANKLWLNNGDGTFTGGQSLGSSYSFGVALGDVDGDGYLDAFVANYGANEVWLNEGNGTFTGGQSLGSSYSFGVALGDVDGDGDLDAFVANGGDAMDEANRVWLNNGDGTFTGGQSLGGSRSNGVALGDLDGDGDLDAFIANYGGANRVWLNNGDGTFTGGQSLGGSRSNGVALGDLDGDGDLDAFVANNGGFLVEGGPNKVWENDGNGNFTEGQSLGDSYSWGVALGDVDADGDLDAFVANISELGEANKVWLNNGDSTFTAVQSLGSSLSMGVALGDVDGDGDLDAFVANVGEYAEGGANRVWLNVFLGYPPTDIALSNDTVPEDLAVDSVIGTLSAVDPDTTTGFIYTITDPDSKFKITEDALQLASALDYETATSHQVTIQVDDGDGNTYSETFTINVTDVNEPPVANDDAYSVDEDTTLNVAAPGVIGNDSDAENAPLTAVIVTYPSSGVLDIKTDGSFTYTPKPDFNGSDSFTYRAYDGELESNVATVTITVNAINDPPVAVDDAYSTNEDTSAAITLTASDVDFEDSLTYIIITEPSHGSLSSTAPVLTYTPDPDYYGSDSFTFKANDGTVDSNIATVSITVKPVNRPPVVNDQTFSVDENSAAGTEVGTVVASDEDIPAQTLTYAITGGTGWAIFGINANTGLVTVTDASALDYESTPSYTLMVKVTDDGSPSASTTATITVDINDVNEPPVATDDAYSVNEDGYLEVTAPGVLGNDSDAENAPLTAALVTGASNGTLTLNDDGSFTYTPKPDFNGSDSFTYRAYDGELESNVATVTITVDPVNDPPVANDDSAITDEDAEVTIDVLANDSDVDDEDLTVVEVTQGENGSVTINDDGTVTYTPDDGFWGTDYFTYTASDGQAESNEATVEVTVNKVIIEVTIDIKPGSDPNSINLGSKGVVPVAVLTTDEFDAISVEPTSVVFAGATPERWTLEDVDGDGDLDLLFHFRTQNLKELNESSEDATLTGETLDGHEIIGTDSVRIVPPKK